MTKRNAYGVGIAGSALALGAVVWLTPVLASQVAMLSLARAAVSVTLVLIVLTISVAIAWLVTQYQTASDDKPTSKNSATMLLLGFCLIVAWFGSKVATRGDTAWEFRIDLMAAGLVMTYVATIAIRQRQGRRKYDNTRRGH